MNEIELAVQLGRFPTGNLCNAHARVQAMDASLAPLFDGATLAGSAKTVQTTPGQNAAIHRAVHHAAKHQVLVVDAGANRSFGAFGDILAACCLNRGIQGLVIDGAVRDSTELRELRFPVFSRGANPFPTEKSDWGLIDAPITCGGTQVAPGDYVVGDADGVVVVPRKFAVDVLRSAQVVATHEREIKAQLASGKTTYEIFELSE